MIKEKQLYNHIVEENLRGKFSDIDELNRNFAQMDPELIERISQIINAFIDEDKIKRYLYGEKVWFVALDYDCVESVYERSVQDEISNIESTIKQTTDNVQKQRLSIKRSIILKIKSELYDIKDSLYSLNEDDIKKYKKEYKKDLGTIESLVSNASEKFGKNFEIDEIYNSEKLKENMYQFPNTNLSTLHKLVEILVEDEKVLLVRIGDNKDFYLDIDQITSDWEKRIESKKNSVKAEAEKFQSTNNEKGKLAGFQPYVIYTEILKGIQKLKQNKNIFVEEKSKIGEELEKVVEQKKEDERSEEVETVKSPIEKKVDEHRQIIEEKKNFVNHNKSLESMDIAELQETLLVTQPYEKTKTQVREYLDLLEVSTERDFIQYLFTVVSYIKMSIQFHPENREFVFNITEQILARYKDKVSREDIDKIMDDLKESVLQAEKKVRDKIYFNLDSH